MKKIKKSKLSINIETIRVIGKAELSRAAGGNTNTCLGTQCFCAPTYVDCTNGCAPQLPTYYCTKNTAGCEPSFRTC